MGQFQSSSPKEIKEKIEDMIWNKEKFISIQTVNTHLNGCFITSDTINEVVETLASKEEDHYKKSMFFLKHDCVPLSDHHHAMWYRYNKMRSTLIAMFIDAKY